MRTSGNDATRPAAIAPRPAAAAAAAAAKKTLAPAAERALAEAAARRAAHDRALAERPQELPGRAGPDPTRYGDWESKGIASDF
jgi:hypothetical protein